MTKFKPFNFTNVKEKTLDELIVDKENEKFFNFPPIKALKPAREEKKQWFNWIKRIYNQTVECNSLPSDKCCDPSFLHTELKRGLDQSLYLTTRQCDKYVLQTNYLIREFAPNKLSLSLLADIKNSGPIEETEKKLNSLLKTSIEENTDIGFYYYGSVGIGKTHKIISYCNDMIKKNKKTVAYVFVPQLVRQVKENFDLDSSVNKKLIVSCCNADILVIDDFGAEYTNTWFYLNVLLIIFNYRCEANKHVIFISNFSFDQLTFMLKGNISLSSNKTVDAANKKIFVDRLTDRIKQLIDKRAVTYPGKSRR